MTISTFQVAASGDDAAWIQSSSTSDTTSTSHVITSGNTGAKIHFGARFALTLPPRAVIVTAELQLKWRAVGAGNDMKATIRAHDVDDSASFGTESVLAKLAEPTGAAVNWFVDDVVGFTDQFTSYGPNIRELIEEIVDRAGWTSGNHAAILLEAGGTPAKYFEAYSYDHAAGDAAKLVVEWLDPATTWIPKANADDGYQTAAGVVNTGDGSFYVQTDMTYDYYRWSAGIRFPGVTIPRGAGIASAKLQLYNWDGSQDDIAAVVCGDDTDDAADVATDGVIYRPRTTATVAWVNGALGGGWVDSPDISAVVQEIVDRSGWTSGNAMAILLIQNGTLYGHRADFAARDSYAGQYAPRLIVEWVPPCVAGEEALTAAPVPSTSVLGCTVLTAPLPLHSSSLPGTIAPGLLAKPAASGLASEGVSLAVLGGAAVVAPSTAFGAATPPEVYHVETEGRPPAVATVGGIGGVAVSEGAVCLGRPGGYVLGRGNTTVVAATSLAAKPAGTSVASPPTSPAITTRLVPPPTSCSAAIASDRVLGSMILSDPPAGLAAAGPSTTYVAAASLAAKPAGTSVALPPTSPAITTRLVPPPTSCSAAIASDRVLGSMILSDPPAGLAAAGPSTTYVAAASLAAKPAGTSVALPPTSPAITTRLVPPPTSCSAAIASDQVLGSVILSDPPAGLAVAEPSIAFIAAASLAAKPAGTSVASPPTSPAITTRLVPPPTSCSAAIASDRVLGSMILSDPPAGLAAAGPSTTYVAAASLAARPAGTSVASPKASPAINTVTVPPPASCLAAIASDRVLGSVVLSDPPAGLAAAGPSIPVIAAASLAARPAGTSLASPPTSPAINTVSVPSPASCSTVIAGDRVLGSMILSDPPAGLAAAGPSIAFRPGVSVFGAPGHASTAATPIAVGTQAISVLRPLAGVVSGETRAALGHRATPPAVGVGLGTLPTIESAGGVVSTKAASLGVATPACVVAGGQVATVVLGLEVMAAPSLTPMAAELLRSPASMCFGRPPAVLTKGGTWLQPPLAIGLVVIAPAGLGAVHIADPDMWYSIDGQWYFILPLERLHYTLEGSMSLAKELHSKTAAETKDLIVDCAGTLASGETITAVTAVTHSPAGLTITGAGVNQSLITEPGRRPVAAGEGLRAFIAGGTVNTTYTITFTYTTSGGQTLQAAVKCRCVG